MTVTGYQYGSLHCPLSSQSKPFGVKVLLVSTNYHIFITAKVPFKAAFLIEATAGQQGHGSKGVIIKNATNFLIESAHPVAKCLTAI